VHRGTFRLARRRPGARRTDARRIPQRLCRGRRHTLRPWPPASGSARVLREVPGPDPVRQGQFPALGVPLLLARLRDRRRILRLLPGLPRVLETLRNGSARGGPAEAVLRECAGVVAGAPDEWLGVTFDPTDPPRRTSQRPDSPRTASERHPQLSL